MIRKLRMANAWFWGVADWRQLAAIGFIFACAVLVAVLVTNADARRDADDRAKQALSRQQETSRSATRRIDLLTGRIQELEGQVVVAQGQNSELLTKVDALAEQLRQSGRTPVVSPGTRTTTTTPPGAGSTSSPTTQPPPAPGASPPTTEQPPPSSPPTIQPPPPCTTVPVLGRCI